MRVSTIIPVYNGAAYIRQAVGAIQQQEYPDMEIIVVDDGSTDDTASVVRGLSGVHYEYQTNQGPGAARNRGLSLATGDVIAFCDADDTWTENKLKIQIPLLEHPSRPGIVIGHSQRVIIRPSDDGASAYEHVGPPVFYLLMGTALIWRHVFNEIGGFPERPASGEKQLTGVYGEDMDWYFRAKEAGVRITFHKDVVQFYLRHSQNLTIDRSNVALSIVHSVKSSLDRRRTGAHTIMMDWSRETNEIAALNL